MKYAMILLLTAAHATAADDAASQKLLKDLQGAYKMTAMERGNETAPTAFFDTIEKIAIKGDKLTMTFKGTGGKSDEKVSTISVNASTKPAQIDFKVDAGAKKEQTALGIISIEGDTVRICFSDETDKKRPTEFKTSKDNPTTLLTMKKLKE